LLFLAGFWDRCVTDLGPAESYTMPMINTHAGDDVAPFHNRQPIVLDARRAALWLDLDADPTPVLASMPAGTLIADPPEPAAA
jgi:putative SOS response-associated peptidase YedK